MSQYKESKDNPLHREFGRWSNTRYILGKCREYCPSVLVLVPLGIVCSSVLTYYTGFLGKFVIDIIGSGLSEQEKMSRLLIIVVVGAVLAGILMFGSTYQGSKVWYRYIHTRMHIIEERIDRALSLDYEYLEKPQTLDVMERAARATGGNTNGVEGMMRSLESLGSSLVTVAVTFVSVTILDVRLILVLTILAVVQYLYYSFCVKYSKKKVWDELGGTWRELNYMERVTQDFDYAKDIRLFSMQDFLLGKQKDIFRKSVKKHDLHHTIWWSYQMVWNVILIITRCIIYGVLFYAVLQKNMTIGNFTLFLSLSMAFSDSMVLALQRFGDIGKCSLEVDDFRSFMELDYKENANVLSVPKKEKYTLEFKNVSYRYAEAKEYALRNLNLKLTAGEKLAVVGINGAGKSTMIKLLLRLYDPTEGTILLDGVDIRSYSKEEYYRLFSPVFQDIEVLAFPIAEHIAMKSMDKTDVERAYACAVEAGLKEKIDSLPKGMHTELLKVVDESGIDLSGGEKQKLALARALYKDAPIIVLDEPTSALDALAEQRLYESFDKMIGDRSAVYISHRLASTKFCEHIAMFKNGEMIEYGTHEELMQRQGEYAHMFELQAQYYREEGGAENA